MGERATERAYTAVESAFRFWRFRMSGRKRQAVVVLEASGRSHMTKAQKAERAAREIVVPEGEFVPPDTLTDGQAEEFCEIAAWMQAVNSKNKERGYGAIYCDRDSEGIAQYIICKDLAHEYQARLAAAGREGAADEERHCAQLHLRYCEMERKFASDIGYDYISRMKRAGPLPDSAGGDDYGGF